MEIDLYQRRMAYRLETVNLTGLDDEDVSGLTLESLSVHRPHSTAFADELNLVVRMPMRPRPRTRLPVEKKYRNTGIPLFRSNKLMRTANKRQVLLAHMMHPSRPPTGLDDSAFIQASKTGAEICHPDRTDHRKAMICGVEGPAVVTSLGFGGIRLSFAAVMREHPLKPKTGLEWVTCCVCLPWEYA